MSKFLMYLVVAAVVLGGGYYLMSRGSATVPTPAAVSSENQAPIPPGSTPASFADIVKGGGSVQCTVSMMMQGTASKGTLYVANAGADVRGDFSTTVAGQTIHSSLVKSGGYVYTWTDAFPQGFKSAAQPSADPIASMNSGTVPPGTQYECRPWTLDASKFAVPTDVKFTEMPQR